ncbi:MAG: hypothetical protein NVSMB29_01750 [Candidatus Dormibacteria bacterium]
MSPALREYDLEAVRLRTLTGVVYAGRYRRTGHPVGLEEIASDLRDTPGLVGRLAECGERASRIRNPHVQRVYDLVAEGGRVYLVTAAPEGRVLRSLVARGAVLPVEDALAIGEDLHAAIEAPPQGGVLHGDVRPEQIGVRTTGESTLRGFGISLAMATTPGVPTWRRPAYPAPERARVGINEAADLWAAAGLIHELAGGAPPHTVDVELVRPLRELLDAALDTDPDRRPRSAEEFRAELSRVAEEIGGSGWRSGVDLGRRVEGEIPPPPVTVELPRPVAASAPAAGGVIEDEDGDEGAPSFGAGRAESPPAAVLPTAATIAAAAAGQGWRDRQPERPPEPRPPQGVQRDPLPLATGRDADEPLGPRRRLGPWLLASLLAVALAVVAALIVVGRGQSTGAGAIPLTIDRAVQLSVTPAQGGCDTTFKFTATGHLHGTGTMTFRWKQSDGLETPAVSVPITADEGSYRFTQKWRIKGAQTAGSMTFTILQPQQLSATRDFVYTCR